MPENSIGSWDYINQDILTFQDTRQKFRASLNKEKIQFINECALIDFNCPYKHETERTKMNRDTTSSFEQLINLALILAEIY